MSKQCMKRRETRREKLVDKYAERRAALRVVINDLAVGLDEKMAASEALQKFPKDSVACRKRRRCWITRRPRGVYRTVGMCRNMFRIHAMTGDIPGIRKASW